MMAVSLNKLIVSGTKALRRFLRPLFSGRKILRNCSEVAKGFKWISGATKEFGAAIWTRDQLQDDITAATKKI